MARSSRSKAVYSVDETLRRAKKALGLFTRRDILWVGPVQGGNHLDLVTKSAKEMAKFPFSIYALGSPTQVMEHYLFDYLVDMIMEAKRNLPVERPLHLFGAGHPFMFALAVALGCDIFDSAAYAIYAREGKYMTDYGTERLDKTEVSTVYLQSLLPLHTSRTPHPRSSRKDKNPSQTQFRGLLRRDATNQTGHTRGTTMGTPRTPR